MKFIIGALAGLLLYLIGVNKRPRTSFYRIKDQDLPQAFDGLKILQISDFHNELYGPNQAHIKKEIDRLDFDMIFITGDFVDRRKLDIKQALDFIDMIAIRGPIFYVNGNHERGIGKNYQVLKKGLEKRGVIVLENQVYSWEKNGARLDIAGLIDPREYVGTKKDKSLDEDGKVDGFIKGLDLKNYCLMLAHRPEKFEVYVANNIDLIFTGHAHGGQARFLGLAGYAPDQGVFPSYSKGIYRKKKSQMVVSRGLGNSRVPLRVFNRPELLVIEINR